MMTAALRALNLVRNAEHPKRHFSSESNIFQSGCI